MEVQVESQVLSSEADSHGGDSRDPVVAVAMLDDGCLATRRPSAPEVGDHEKTALVEEGQVRPQPLGFFLMAVQGSGLQRLPSFSFRPRAARLGYLPTPHEVGQQRTLRDVW